MAQEDTVAEVSLQVSSYGYFPAVEYPKKMEVEMEIIALSKL